MRISRVCAWNTSRLAYDGSGTVCPVTREITVSVHSRQEKDITVTCRHRIISEQDILSRELLKPLPVTERSLLEAKVPSVKRRTSCVYADLKRTSFTEMELLKAA